jgi:hypothetical protein
VLSIDPEKETGSKPIETLVSVNGLQVWLENKFDEEELQETPIRKSFADITTTDKIQNNKQ